MPLPESRREIEELLAEAKYYLVQGLVDECQAALQVGRAARARRLSTHEPFGPCSSPAAQSSNESQLGRSRREAAPQPEHQLRSERGAGSGCWVPCGGGPRAELSGSRTEFAGTSRLTGGRPEACVRSASVCFLFQQNKDAYEPFCKVPVITSSKEEQKLIATSNKVRGGRCRWPAGLLPWGLLGISTKYLTNIP